MLTGIGFVTGDPTLKLDYPYVSHAVTQIKATTVGDLKWMSMMLPLHKGDTITAIKLSYRNSSARSFISQIRLTSQLNPPIAMVRHDDGTDLLSTIPVTQTSVVNNLVVDNSIVLSLRLNFGNLSDMIEIGAVEIVYK